MRKLILLGLALVLGFISILVTVEGWVLLLEHFTGKEVASWGAFWLSLGFGFLRHNPLALQKKLEKEAEILGYAIGALIVDCLAVYLIIPHALSYF